MDYQDLANDHQLSKERFKVMDNDILALIASKAIPIEQARLAFLIADRCVMQDESMVDEQSGFQCDDGTVMLKRGQSLISHANMFTHCGDVNASLASLQEMKNLDEYEVEFSEEYAIVTRVPMAQRKLDSFGKIPAGVCEVLSHKGYGMTLDDMAVVAHIARFSNGSKHRAKFSFVIADREIHWQANPGETRIVTSRMQEVLGVGRKKVLAILKKLSEYGVIIEPSNVNDNPRHGLIGLLNSGFDSSSVYCDRGSAYKVGLKERVLKQLSEQTEGQVRGKLGTSKGQVRENSGESKGASKGQVRGKTLKKQEAISDKRKAISFSDDSNRLHEAICNATGLAKRIAGWDKPVKRLEEIGISLDELIEWIDSGQFTKPWGDGTSWSSIASTPAKLSKHAETIASRIKDSTRSGDDRFGKQYNARKPITLADF